MSDEKMTRHIIEDIETGFSYALALDAKTGECIRVQPLTADLHKPKKQEGDNTLVTTIGSLVQKGIGLVEDFPYGKTTVMIEKESYDENNRKQPAKYIFTLDWPSREELNGSPAIYPTISKKEISKNLAQELAAVGIAPVAKKRGGTDFNNDAVVEAAMKNIKAMIGLDAAKEQLRAVMAKAQIDQLKKKRGLITKSVVNHMVFYGNPGTGKTTFAREVAKFYKAIGILKGDHVIEVKAKDLISDHVGGTAKAVDAAVTKAMGGVLLIDEAHALAQQGKESSGGKVEGSNFGAQAIDALVALMEDKRGDFVVIAAGYPEEMKQFIEANPGLKSRFKNFIDFQDYTIPQLGEIMDTMLKDYGLVMSTEARSAALKVIEQEKERTKKDFGNGRVVRNLVEKVSEKHSLRLKEENIFALEGKISDEELDRRLVTVELADVTSVDLRGISNKVEGGIPPQLGVRTVRYEPVNTNKAAPAAVPPAVVTAAAAKSATVIAFDTASKNVKGRKSTAEPAAKIKKVVSKKKTPTKTMG